LVLIEDNLIVIVEGYSSYETDGNLHVVSQRRDILVQMYDTQYLMNVDTNADTGSGLIGSTYLHGSFDSIDIINGLLSIATRSYINSYELLVVPFERYKIDFQKLNDSEYKQKVRQLAPQQVELFRNTLIQDLSINKDDLPNFVRINPWVKKFSATCWSQAWDFGMNADGLMNGLFFVHSINISSPVENKDIKVSTSAVFTNEYDSRFLASGKHSILTLPNIAHCKNDTYQKASAILSYKRDEDSIKPSVLDVVTGRIMKSDIASNTARFLIEQWPNIFDVMSAMNATGRRPQPTNQLTILSLDRGNEMDETYLRQLSSVYLEATDIRFFDTYAYVRKNRTSMSVVDFSDPENPIVSQSFKDVGIRGSLYSLNDDDSLLLSISEEFNNVQLHMIDTTIPASPILLHNYNLSQSLNAHAWSDSAWSFKAAYLGRSYIALPVDTDDWNQTSHERFHGYLVFKVDRNVGFTEVRDCRIVQNAIDNMIHSYEEERTLVPEIMVNDAEIPTGSGQCDYCFASLDRRALLFDTNLLMATGVKTISTINLESCSSIWNTTITFDGNNHTCCN
jgi:Beta propeller domain